VSSHLSILRLRKHKRSVFTSATPARKGGIYKPGKTLSGERGITGCCLCFDDPNLSRYLHLISHIGHRQRRPRLANLLLPSSMMVVMTDCRFPGSEDRYILYVRVKRFVHVAPNRADSHQCSQKMELTIPLCEALIAPPHIQDLGPTSNKGRPQGT